jgi:hypothetical protein
MHNKTLRELYLDYVNNYLTVAKFAEHNGITVSQASTLIFIGRDLHERYVELNK